MLSNPSPLAARTRQAFMREVAAAFGSGKILPGGNGAPLGLPSLRIGCCSQAGQSAAEREQHL